MRVTPKTDKQINEENLIPHKTICDFEVVEAKNTKSKKSGADMVELKMKVFYNEGYKLVTDYLLDAMAAKLRHFCEGTGLLKEYEDESLNAADCLGRCGKCKVKMEPAGEYPAKNSIWDYVVKEKEKVIEKGAPADEGDSEVPF